MHPFALHQFDSDGVALAYIDAAPQGTDHRDGGRSETSGDPILLIHGFASNHAVNWVNTGWVRTLTQAGHRVIALDNRGHGRSEKLYDPASYSSELMAEDARRLLDHLRIARADVMGYSMGARITAHLALEYPARVRAALLGGLGLHLVEGNGLPSKVPEAMEAPSRDAVVDPTARAFRIFAEGTGSDLRAMAACMRGSRQTLSRAEVSLIEAPTLVSVGTRDEVAGSGPGLAALLPNGQALDLPDRDHGTAVGDKGHKAGVLAFLAARP